MAQNKAKSLSERTADELYDIIVVRQEFAPGDKLPNENELADRMGVSRTTLREAVRFLVARGVLKIERGKGTYITEDLVPGDPMDMSSLEQMRVRLSDMYEIRLMFEPQCMLFACRRASDDELEGIRAQAELIEALLDADGNWPDADQEFHEMIAAASHNEFIIRLFPIINSAVHQAMLLLNDDSKRQMKDVVKNDNRVMLNFLMIRDGDGAKSAMSIHIRHVINSLRLDVGN